MKYQRCIFWNIWKCFGKDKIKQYLVTIGHSSYTKLVTWITLLYTHTTSDSNKYFEIFKPATVAQRPYSTLQMLRKNFTDFIFSKFVKWSLKTDICYINGCYYIHCNKSTLWGQYKNLSCLVLSTRHLVGCSWYPILQKSHKILMPPFFEKINPVRWSDQFFLHWNQSVANNYW